MRRPPADVVALNVLLVPFLLWGLHAADTDTFFHLALGRWMFEHGEIPNRETFSFTNPGRPWVNGYWLFQWLLYGSWRVGGYLGIVALRGAAMLATANLLWSWIRARTGGARLETFAFGLVAFSLWLPRALNMRGQVFSYLFLMLLIRRLDRFSRGPRRFDPVLPALCVLWANVHGVAYPIALAVVGVHALAALAPHFRRRAVDACHDPSLTRWGWVLLACVLAFALNPSGFALHGTVLLSGQTEALSQIDEMSRTDLRTFLNLVPGVELWSATTRNWMVIAGALLCLRWLRRGQALALGSFGVACALLFSMPRFGAEYGLLAVPFIAESVAQMRAENPRRARTLGFALAGLCVCLVTAVAVKVGGATRSGRTFLALNGDLFPIGPARQVLENGLSGNLFCDPTLAGYLTWELHPSRVRVFMDMRTPILFPARDLWLYKAVGDTVPLQALDARYKIDLLMLARDAPLAARVLADPGSPFALTWADQRFLLFVHQRRMADRERLRLLSYPAMARAAAGEPFVPGDDPGLVEREALRLLATWPDNQLAHASLARALLAQGRASEALERLSLLVQRHPRAAVYRLHQASALTALGRHDEAVAALREARRRMPDFLDSYPVLAELLAATGRPRDAREVLEDYSRRRRFRLSAPEHVLLGRLRHATSDLDPAADAYVRALWQLPDPDPLRLVAERGLAIVLLERGEAAEALALLERAGGGAPLPLEAAWARAHALRMLGRVEEARAAFRGLAADEALPQSVRSAARVEAAR